MYDGKHKVSAKYIPITIIRFMRQSIIAIIAVIIGLINIADEFASDNLAAPINVPVPVIIIVGILLFLIPCIIASIVLYTRFRWELTDEEVHIYKGLIKRKQLHVPYKRIHSADINAKVFDRILGVVTLKMDTAGGGPNADVQIPALERAVAERLKDEVFRRKATMEGEIPPDGDEYVDVPLGVPVHTDDGDVYKLSVGELILSGISSASSLLVILIAIGGISQIVGMLGQYSEKIWGAIGSVAASLYGRGLVMVIVVVIVILLISMAISVIGKVITLWDFTVKRSGKNIEVRRGLLERNATSIAVNRIQAVRFKQGILRRIIGYTEITVERVAVTIDTQNGAPRLHDSVLHPFIKKKKVHEFMEAILPEFAGAPAEETLITLGVAALRRSFFRFGRWMLLLIDLPLFIAWYLVGRFAAPVWGGAHTLQNVFVGAAIVLLVYLFITAFFTWRGRAVGYDESMLVIREGAYGRNFIYIPRRKIQYAVKAQNPFQKHAGLATISAHSAAPTLRKVETIDVSGSYADDYLEWVERHTAEVRAQKSSGLARLS
jgi:putative membrane protein